MRYYPLCFMLSLLVDAHLVQIRSSETLTSDVKVTDFRWMHLWCEFKSWLTSFSSYCDAASG